MNGNVTFVGLNFQERVEEEHLKKEGNNGEIRLSRFSLARTHAHAPLVQPSAILLYCSHSGSGSTLFFLKSRLIKAQV